MWPSVPKIIPEKQLGTAYAVIFWIQNIGLLFIPLLLGIVLNTTNPDVSPNKILVKGAIEKAFKQTLEGNSFTDKEITKAIDKATETAVDSIVQYATYQPIPYDNVDTNYLAVAIYSSISEGINNIDFSGEKDLVLQNVIHAGERNAYLAIEKEKLNLRYDYYYDMMIFLALSLLSLLFAFLLRIEDRKKGYGLEMPNIVKEN